MQNEKLFDTLQIVSHLESEYQLYRELCENFIIESKTSVTTKHIFELGPLIVDQSNISKNIADIQNEVISIFGKYDCVDLQEFFDKNEDYREFAVDSIKRFKSIFDVANVLNAHLTNEHKGIVQDAGLN